MRKRENGNGTNLCHMEQKYFNCAEKNFIHMEKNLSNGISDFLNLKKGDYA